MRKIIIYFICHLFYFSNAQTVEWVNTVGGKDSDFGRSIISDSLGNSYVLGKSTGKVDIDPGIDTLYGQSSGMFIHKLNSKGELIWAHFFRATSNGIIKIDNDGNPTIMGILHNSNVDLDPGPNEYQLSVEENYNIFILKLDVNGNFILAKNALNGCVTCSVEDLKFDEDDNIISVGAFRGNVDFSPSFSMSSDDLDDNDAFVAKYDKFGVLIWAKKFRGVEDAFSESLALDNNGNIYIGGSFYKRTDFDPGVGTFYMNTLDLYSDAFLVKLDRQGNFVWAKEYNSNANSRIVISEIKIDNNQDLIVVGSFEFTPDFDLGPNANFETSKGYADIFLLKLDLDANFKWVKTYGGIGFDYAFSIEVDTNNNYFLGSMYEDNISLGNDLPNFVSNGKNDIIIIKTDSNGNGIWAKSLGGIGNDFCLSMTFSNNYLFLTGGFSETTQHDCFENVSNGDYDFFSLKISECIPENSVDTIVACDSYKWIDGVTYTNSIDSIIYSPLNNICCDSTFTLNLTINKSSYDVLQITAQDSFVWNDSTYTTTGNYVKVYTNRNGCDSTVHVNLFIIQDEICNNELDDDNDGYVDGFDSDCPCSDTLYNNLCDPICQYTNIDTAFKLIKKWESEIIGSSWSSVLVYDTFIYTKKISGGYSYFAPESENAIVKISGISGKTISDNPVSSSTSWPSDLTPLSVFKWKDTTFAIVLHRDTLMMYDEYHNKKWESYGWWQFARSAINVYDINLDGVPEIIISNKIVSIRSGIILLEDTIIKGYNSIGTGVGAIPFDRVVQCNSVAVDLLPTPGLEIAAGNIVYEVILNNNESSIGNQFIAHTADAPVQNGITSVGDIDGDGLLDVIVVRNQYYEDGGGIYVWNPRTGAMIARASSGESGSVPFVGDVDGDCHPEIGVVFANQLRMFRYDGTTNLKIMYTIPTSEGSGNTGITMFDFNQDGKNELVYRDETTLRIFEGATGKVLASTPMLSSTGMEYPVVADIDNDGQAEILTSGYMPGEEERDSRVYCFKSGGTPWAPARSVWNQYGYHVTNVNDDLTIPRYQQNSAAFFDTDSCAQFTCPQPYNNFMVQATYRTQKGCVVWPASDVSLSVMRYECNADSLIFYLVVGNEGNKNITEDTMNLSIYATIPDMTTSPLDRHTIYLSRDVDGNVSRSDTIRLAMVMPTIDIKSILFRINDAGLGGAYSALHGLSPTLECDYENNIALVAIDISKRTLDLGPDIHKCRTEVITLDASSGFVSYLWSDLSEDDIFITSEAGVYSLIATDQCGRRYQDTVTFTIDESLKPKLGPDILLCEGDTTSISVGSEFTWVQWYPVEMVSCDTCFSTSVTADTTFDLVLISNKSGCIDADTVTIDIKALPRSEKQTSICAGTSIDFYGQEIDAAGKYEHRLGHCDSLIILDVTLLRRDSTILSHDICVGDSILVFDTWYDSPTEATLTGKNVYGCDSIVQVSLKVIDTLTSVQSLSFCEGDSIFVQDRWIKIAGTYDYAFTSSRGCDSIATFELVEIPTSSSVNNFSFCQGDSIYVADRWYFDAGSYEAIRTNAMGCDSIINIEISTFPTSSDMRAFSICVGDSIQIHNTWQHQTGTYTETFTNSQGCDSTSVVTLSVAPFLLENDSLSICDGDSIIVNGQMVYTEGLYVDTIDVVGSCQKILTTQVTLMDRVEESMLLTLCPDSSVTVGNLVIDESGTFTIDLTSQAGCDSTLTIVANKLTWPQPPSISINCKDEQYTATWIPQAPWNIEWSDGSTDTIFRQEEGGTITMRSYTDGCDKVFEYDLPPIPKLSDIPKLGDQLVKGSVSLPLSVDLDEVSWTIEWSPGGLLSCATCFDTEVTTDSDTTITVVMTHESGCSFEQQFRIIRDVSSVISIPNIFNPTSTGGNDLWTVTVPSGSLVAEVYIYDRWGNQVFTSKNGNQITWDGNYQGKELSTGVYVYHVKVIDGDGKISMLYGDVTLVR